MPTDPEFASNGGGAAFGNPRLTRQARTIAESRATGTDARVTKVAQKPASEDPPPKASAAPTKGTDNLFSGLADALNQHQQELVKKYPGYVADQYSFEFAPASIGASKVTKPGAVTYKNTAGKNVKTADDKLDPATDKVNTDSETWQILAGTQIVQFIDQVMRSSEYITGQQKVNFDEDGKQTKNAQAGSGGVTAWYKISLKTKQLAYDKVRRDYAYAMTFTISPYAINQMCSVYFPDSKYRGAHKAYNYWFTGANTQILSYEQDYNQAYYTTITSNATGLVNPPPTGRDQFKQAYMATSEQRGQGQANYVNEPADNAAAFLYSVSDFSEVRLKIVGDPAWMQQGEAAFGVNAATFEFNPFNADGTINYDSQEVTFTVSFSRPTDYNFSKGIMEISATGAPQETFTFIAKSCRNTFSKGQFTQELVGSLLPGTNSTNQTNAANGRTNPLGGVVTAAGSRTSTVTQVTGNTAPSGDTTTAPSDKTGNTQGNDPSEENGGTPSPQPAPAPEAPTSSGDIEPANEDVQQNDPQFAPTETQYGAFGEAPQVIARDDD